MRKIDIFLEDDRHVIRNSSGGNVSIGKGEEDGLSLLDTSHLLHKQTTETKQHSANVLLSAVSEDVENAAGSTLCFQSLSNFADDLLNCKVVRLNEGYSYVLSELKRDALSIGAIRRGKARYRSDRGRKHIGRQRGTAIEGSW